MPDGGSGEPSGNPVIDASPACASMVGAYATRSRHGPVTPYAGARNTMSSGYRARSVVLAQFPVLQHPGTEVVDHDVAVADEVAQDLAAARVSRSTARSSLLTLEPW